MPRRPFCTGKHQWVSEPRKGPDYWKCTECPAQVPCPGTCAHFDCEDVRGKAPRCPKCKKPVPQDESYFHMPQSSTGDKSVRYHKENCVPDEKEVHPDAHETAEAA